MIWVSGDAKNCSKWVHNYMGPIKIKENAKKDTPNLYVLGVLY